MKTSLSVHVPSLLLAAALVGCSSLETSITRPEDQATTMELVVETEETTSSTSAAPDPGFNIVVSDDANTLSIGRATIVVRELAFRRQEGEGCVDADGSGEPDEDSCAEIVIEPDLIDLPVDQNTISSGPLVVEPGTYDALVFDLHETREEDLNVVNQRPGLVGVSVAVAGSYNGSPLGDSAVFTPTEEFVLLLDDPIGLEEGFASGMTLSVDVASWFRDAEGTVVNPAEAAQDSALSEEVDQRILDSFSIRAGT